MSSNVESKCDQHRSEEYRFYCEDCQILICDDCITSAHKTHKNIKIKEYGARTRNELNDLTAKAQAEKIPEMQTAVEKAKQSTDAFRQSVQEEIKKVQSKREMINLVFDELEKELTDALTESEKDASVLFEKFVKNQTEKIDSIQKAIADVKSRETNISDDEVAKYNIAFKRMLERDPFTDSVPSPPKLYHIFNLEFSRKEKLQDVIGFVQSDDYSIVDVPPVIPSRPKTQLVVPTETHIETSQQKTEDVSNNDLEGYISPENSSDIYEKGSSPFSIISMFKSTIPIWHIVPKARDRQAWIIGGQIVDIDCSGEEDPRQTQMLPLTNTVVTTCLAKNDKLLLGRKGQTNLTKLEIGTKNKKLVGSFKVCSGNENLACICRSVVSQTEHVACIETASQFVLRRYTGGKSSCQDIPLTDIDNPIQINDDQESNVCILCRPESNNSWIVVFDKNGEKKFKYPKEADDNITQKYVGFGFMKDKTIIVMDQTSFKMKLINMDGGTCLSEIPVDRKPVCCSMDKSYNIWVGFSDDIVKVLKYNAENIYDELDVKDNTKGNDTKF